MISADDVKANNKNKKYIANILVALPYKFFVTSTFKT